MEPTYIGAGSRDRPGLLQVGSLVDCHNLTRIYFGLSGEIRTPGVILTPRPKRGPLPSYGLRSD